VAQYSRSQCREWALQCLYQAEHGGPQRPEAIADLWRHFQKADAAKEAPAYFMALVEGVAAHQEELDALIARHSEHWRLERMSAVDRNLLRLALYELVYQPHIPPKVVINEAVELAKRYGSEQSGAFVNALLDRIRQAVGREV
jgi:N utilization substance protein B